MTIEFARTFEKQYARQPVKIRHKFNARLEIWKQNPNDLMLHDHALSGKYQGYRSINITGDIRALYVLHGKRVVIFGFIGTHSQLYG